MSRFPMKLFVSAAGSLALMIAAGCEQRTTTTPSGDPATTAPSSPNEDVNALRPTPSTSAGGASAVSNSERLPVSGSEADPMGGGGKGGHAGHGGSHSH